MVFESFTQYFLNKYQKKNLVIKSKVKFILYYLILLISFFLPFAITSFYKNDALLSVQNIICSIFIIAGLIALKKGRLSLVVDLSFVFIGFLLQSTFVIRNMVGPNAGLISNFGSDPFVLISIITLILTALIGNKLYQVLTVNFYTLGILSLNLFFFYSEKLTLRISMIVIILFCSLLSIIVFYIMKQFEKLVREKEALNQVLKQKIIQERRLKIEADSANKAKSEFLSTISHELLTPMNSIIGFTGILLEKNQNAPHYNFLKLINESASELLFKISEILDFSKIELGKLSLNLMKFSLKEQLNQVYLKFYSRAKEKSLIFSLDIAGNVPEIVSSDPRLICQILTSLVDNAIKYTDNGFINLECKLKIIDNERFINISVSDSGIGIHKKEIDHLFEKFKQIDGSLSRKKNGMGLGLVKAKAMVNLMGGKITVDSEENKGSIFSFDIPVIEQAFLNQNIFQTCVQE